MLEKLWLRVFISAVLILLLPLMIFIGIILTIFYVVTMINKTYDQEEWDELYDEMKRLYTPMLKTLKSGDITDWDWDEA